MTAIQRFALHGTIMNPHSSGPYVRHEDHLAAMQGRCLAQIEEPAGAAPAAVAGPAWDKTRHDLAIVMMGFAGNPSRSLEVAEIVLDAATEPGAPMAYLRGAPAAPAAPVDDRAEFEKWARQQSWIKDCQRYDDGRYGHWETEKAWAAWQARAALAAAPQAPAAQVIENLLQLARIVNTAVEDWGETKEDDSLEVIFHKEEADKLEDILEFFDSLPDAPESEGVILSGPSRAARVLRAQAAPAAPAVDASDTALLDAMERERIAVIPEFEGPWDAQIYGEDETTLACGSGTTPRKAIAEALASLEARKAHDAAQAKEGGTQ